MEVADQVALSAEMRPGRIDSVAGPKEAGIHVDVGSGKAEGAAALVAHNDGAAQGVVAAEQAGATIDIAVH